MVLRNGGTILTALDRITQPVTDFIRGNPIVSTAAIGIGTTGLVLGAVSAVRKRRKKKAAKRKRVSKKKRSRKKKKKVTHRSPRHKGHKRVSFTTAGGKRVNFLVKRKAHTHKRVKRKKKKR